MKKKVSVTIDDSISKRAEELGLNKSRIAENAIKSCIDALETAMRKQSLFAPDFSGKSGMAGGEGFEPSTPNLGGADFWNNFRAHLKEKKYLGGYDTTLFNYAQLYSDCLFKHDLSKVSALADGKRPNVLKALSALAKFAGCYEQYKLDLKNYGLSWVGRNGSDIFIDRLINVQGSEEIWEWVKLVKETRPELTDLLDLMTVSGLRFVEAVNSNNLIVKLNDEGKLDLDRTGKDYRSGYFNRETLSLEHFWFGKLFIRNTKKAFVSFVPEQIINNILSSEKIITTDRVKKLIQKRDLPLRFGDIREAQGTFMTKYLKESEINFLHGRVTSSVFMSNYFNPSLIADLKARTFQGIAEIQNKIQTA